MLARLRDELRKAYAVIMALEAQARPSTRGLPALLHRCGMALARRLARPRFSLRMRPCSAALGMAGEAASRGPVPRKVGYSLTYKRPCDLDLQVPGSTPAFFKGVLQDHAFCLFCGAVTNASAEPGNTVRDKVSHRAARSLHCNVHSRPRHARARAAGAGVDVGRRAPRQPRAPDGPRHRPPRRGASCGPTAARGAWARWSRQPVAAHHVAPCQLQAYLKFWHRQSSQQAHYKR